MDSNAQLAYWETQVLTASPQKLRLILIDGAIKYTRQVLQFWSEANYDDGFTAMMRTQDIVVELMSSIEDNGTELNRQVKSLYIFIYQSLINGQLKHDRQHVEDALRILNEERETWRLVCAQLVETPDRSSVESGPKEITSGNLPTILPNHVPVPSYISGGDHAANSPGKSAFSLDA